MTNITGGYYDLTNISNSENILEFTQAVNALTGEYLMLGILIAGFFILFLSTMKYGIKNAMASSSFITAIISVMFLTLGFIQVSFFLLIIIPTGAIYVMSILSRD